jgi:pyroglutamyl-peptidase
MARVSDGISKTEVVAPVVIAAFEPFAGRRRNRAEEAARLLLGSTVAGHPVSIERLPTAFASLPQVLARLFDRNPAVLLLVGESRSARTLLLERIAVNVAHARIADNLGVRPIDQVLEPGAHVARKVTFDPRRVCNVAIAAGAPCEVSSHAGTFCCNAALFHGLGQAAVHPRRPVVAFVHVPQRWPFARDRRAAKGIYAIASELLRLQVQGVDLGVRSSDFGGERPPPEEPEFI